MGNCIFNDNQKQIQKSEKLEKSEKSQFDKEDDCANKENKEDENYEIDDIKIQIEKLKILNDENYLENLSFYTLKDKILPVKITNIHDGDTLTTVYYINSDSKILIKRSCRLYGIDAPEIGRGGSNSIERKAGILVGKWLVDYIRSHNSDNIIWIRFMKEEKFGRDMGILYLNYPSTKIKNDNDQTKKKKLTQKAQNIENMQGSINQILIDLKLAKSYFGEAKNKWTNKELNHIISFVK